PAASSASSAEPTVPAFKPFDAAARAASAHRWDTPSGSSPAATRQTSLQMPMPSPVASPSPRPMDLPLPASQYAARGDAAPAPEATGPPAPVAFSQEGTPAMQVCNRYLITENEEGVVLIDQHALHERIIYEELREKVLSDSIEIQRLLVPEPVQLLPQEASVLIDARETLRQLGIELEPMSNTSVVVNSYPAMLTNVAPDELLKQLADKLSIPNAQVEQRDLIDELLHMISCKAAIKAGDRLSRDEVMALVSQRHLVQDAHHCPHGRPTTLVFSREELDRRFKRI
ncbi:MAG: DNA mismatch repair protein MutL, partial [Planctomycetota bacterium]